MNSQKLDNEKINEFSKKLITMSLWSSGEYQKAIKDNKNKEIFVIEKISNMQEFVTTLEFLYLYLYITDRQIYQNLNGKKEGVEILDVITKKSIIKTITKFSQKLPRSTQQNLIDAATQGFYSSIDQYKDKELLSKTVQNDILWILSEHLDGTLHEDVNQSRILVTKLIISDLVLKVIELQDIQNFCKSIK